MWVEETKNGKFKFKERYTDYLTGKQKFVSVTMDKKTRQTYKIASAVLQEKIRSHLCVSTSLDFTFSDLCEDYLRFQKQSVKLSTYERNRYQCQSLKKILGEDILIEKLTARYIVNTFLASGKKPVTLNEHLTRLKAMIRWAYKNDYIQDISFLNKLEPFKDIPKKVKISDKFLEHNELVALIDGMNEPKWKLLTRFLVLSGLRSGEALALYTSDLDFHNRIIHVNKTYDHVHGIVTPPKTLCSIRDIYMQDELYECCKEILSHFRFQRIVYHIHSPYLFQNKKGECLSYYSYNKYLRENSFRILQKKITPHVLRHTHASLLLAKGISIDSISRRLGHENSKITKEIYLHITKELIEKDNKELSLVKIL